MKPFTSKHCTQYLTKESPFYQTKELTDKPKVRVAREPEKTYEDEDGVVRDENNKPVGTITPTEPESFKAFKAKRTGKLKKT